MTCLQRWGLNIFTSELDTSKRSCKKIRNECTFTFKCDFFCGIFGDSFKVQHLSSKCSHLTKFHNISASKQAGLQAEMDSNKSCLKSEKKHFSTELYLSSLFTAVVYHYKCSMNHPMKYNPMFFLHLMQHAASLKANNPFFFRSSFEAHISHTSCIFQKKERKKDSCSSTAVWEIYKKCTSSSLCEASQGHTPLGVVSVNTL